MLPATKVYKNHVRETTEWEDILVEKNILAPDAKLEVSQMSNVVLVRSTFTI
jgi:hypothetical protein